MSPEEDAFFELIETLLLENASEWRVNMYDLDHDKAGISIWHDASIVRVDSANVRISWAWKRRLRRVVNKCLALKAVERLKVTKAKAAA